MTRMLNARASLRAVGLAAILAASFAGAAIAEDVKIPDGQLPPPEQAEPQKPKQCVSHEPGFWTHKGVHTFKVALTNSCERRQRCTVNVYLVTSRGPQQERATLTLAKASRGKAAQKDYVIRTPENGGSAQVSMKCVRV
jgi:hypothetical protein